MLWTSKIPSLSLSSHPFSKPLIKVQLALACSVVLHNGFSCLLGPGEITGDSMGEILLLKSPGYKFSLVVANTRKGDVGLTCKYSWLGFWIIEAHLCQILFTDMNQIVIHVSFRHISLLKNSLSQRRKTFYKPNKILIKLFYTVYVSSYHNLFCLVN